MSTGRVYLDHNAGSPLRAEARAAMLAAVDTGGNASSVHAEGRAARRLVEDARRQVGALVGAQPASVVFSSGATEAANFLLSPAWTMGRAPLGFGALYVCTADHPATLSGGRFASENIRQFGVDAEGIARLDVLRSLLQVHDRATGLPLVAVHGANNETGVIQPLSEIARIVKDAGGVLVVDAVQLAGRADLDIAASGADFLILSSHKIGGPQGAGAIIGRADLMMPVPLLRGGGQERGFRAGTENVAAIAGFGAAAKVARDELGSAVRVAQLRDMTETGIAKIEPSAIFHGRGAVRLPNTTFFSLPDMKAETAQIALDIAGVAVSAGSACSSGKVGPSHVLKAMGADAALGAVRVSLAASNTEADVARLLDALAKLVGRHKGARAA